MGNLMHWHSLSQSARTAMTLVILCSSRKANLRFDPWRWQALTGWGIVTARRDGITTEDAMKHLLLIPILFLAACQQTPGQNRYGHAEVGKATVIEYARVLGVKQVEITGKNSGVGAAGGAAGGAIAGSHIGSGRGQLAGMLAGVIVGGIVGHALEQEMQNMVGYEYRVKTEDKKIKTIVQHQNKDDIVFKKGDKVMIQINGEYQRVLPREE